MTQTSNSNNNKPAPATSSAYEYLTRALQLLEKPGPKQQPNSWIRDREAINAQGEPCSPESEQAEAWCTIGVLKAVTRYDADPEAAYRYCLSVLNAANPLYVATGSKQAQPQINDDPSTTSFETIQRLFQKGIALAAKWNNR